MTVRISFPLAIWLVVGATAWAQQGVSLPGRVSRYGTIAGRVTSSQGLAQAGVPVTVMRQGGLFAQKVYTGRNGRFDLSKLLPGIYAVEVSLPDFLPFSKTPIAVRSGAAVLMDINLRKLTESMEIGLPEDPPGAREDWKWTLRTASPSRPILRFQDKPQWSQRTVASSPRERPLRGTVLVSAGNETGAFGADPGLRTLFDVSYDWTGSSALDLGGSAGLERGTPAASLRTAWRHRSDNGSNSTFSATVRQLFLAPGYQQEASDSGLPSGRRIQSVSVGYQDETPLTERLTLRFGTFFDSLTLRTRMSQWSPYGQLTYTSGERARWTFAYTAAAPRLLPSGPGTDSSPMAGLLAIPQVSSRAGSFVTGLPHTALEAGKHVEAGWERSWGARYQFRAATFYDALSDVALSVSAYNRALFPAGLLKDPFSNTHFLDGGNFSMAGARAAMGTRLWRTAELILGYSYAGGLQALSHDLTAENSQALRDTLRAQREHSFVVKLRSTLPWTRTEVITSYKWLPRNTVIPGDPYDNGPGRSEPYLNAALVQPLPSYGILPGHFQAIAHFTNLLAQGYVPIHGPDGSTSYFFPSARSFRGGFSFVF